MVRAKRCHWFSVLVLMAGPLWAIDVQIDAARGQRPISPYLYGKNNCLSDDPQHPLTAAQWQRQRDAGVRMMREGGGNNSTKYNWVLKLSSHPDWYNNVYRHDWDYAVTSLQAHLPGVQGMWSFQLIGKAAATSATNFNDWAYNHSQWWSGVHNNWAGGGGPGLGDGDPNLYLMDWSADDTTAILDHWLSPNDMTVDPNFYLMDWSADETTAIQDHLSNLHGLNVDPNGVLYWNMDNEPEIWSGTHDDVYPNQPSAAAFMQMYFNVARQARARFPRIKLVGPVPANEWQWYNWDNQRIRDGNDVDVWLEYFIKRIGEEEQATGVRLLDVLDVHFYPSETDPADIVQLYRVWFDRTYDYPGANGVKRLGHWGWDDTIRQEYIFGRCREWLNEYLGPDNGVGLGVTELGIPGDNPNVTAVCYASILGTFADHGVELLTPWTWKVGMWEVLHLFSRYQQPIRVQSTSDQDETVSAYSSINADMNDVTIILVNRDLERDQPVTVTLHGFDGSDPNLKTLQLSQLPDQETYISHTDNALQHGTVVNQNGIFEMFLPPLSITAILVPGRLTGEPNDGSALPAR